MKFNLDGTPKIFNNTSCEITLIDSTTKLPHTITQLPIHPLFKYLENESVLSDTTKHQLLTINKHTLRGARIISNSKLNMYYISLYLKTYLHPKITPRLACFYLSTNQYNFIQNNCIITALSSMGYNNTCPLILRYDDHIYCELQLWHFEPESFISKVQKLLLLLMKADTSNLITMMLVWYQHVSGFSSSILEKH